MPPPRADAAPRAALPVLLLLLAGCAGSGVRSGGPEPVPERPPVVVPAPPPGPTVVPPPLQRRPILPADQARDRGLMPLSSIGLPQFLAAHPEWDGRGVLIAILDSGLDPAVGFDSTSGGRSKILDLRDFSGEGRIRLAPAAGTGDTLAQGSVRLGGLSRVRGLAGGGQLYTGIVSERPLGEMPAADLNDNGFDGDSLPVVVAKATDGWVLFADTDGDGTVADERPVHDYLVARETLGWRRGGEPAPVSVAVNFGELGGSPVLDLFFDTSAHGTHVAGIAAGRGIGGAPHFDGAAPGAQLLGLKIARNDFGGITTTGSVMAALTYAIRFAEQRRMPLVVNMSFGVGNAREGSARIDQLLDSVLSAHPEVIFVTSAGNDGPGISTMGFPGSARRAITVGGTQPAAFIGSSGPEWTLYFSARGGELAKPDVVVPGIAYSAIPRWNLGDEVKGGTSMASPLVAGMSAVLLSAAQAEHRSVTAEDVRRALAGSARMPKNEAYFDAGAGLPDMTGAWGILRGASPPAAWDVEVVGQPGQSASFKVAAGKADSVLRFVVHRWRGAGRVEAQLKSNAGWLLPPSTVVLEGERTEIAVRQEPPIDREGVYSGTVEATMAGVQGPLFSLVSTVVVPAPDTLPTRISAKLPGGGLRRLFFRTDPGRPFRVRMATGSYQEKLIASLHQPGGAPIFGENGLPGGPDTTAAVFDVDGRDARAGFYEAIAAAPGSASLTARISVDPSPAMLRAAFGRGDTLVATLTGVGRVDAQGRVLAGILGGERRQTIAGNGGADVITPLAIPSWVDRVVVDLSIAPELWPRFTDFGFTLLDAEGRILGKEPVNYPDARLTVTLPRTGGDRQTRLVLSPGLAEAMSREAWSTRVSIRFEAERAHAVPLAGGQEVTLLPRQTKSLRGVVGELPWALPPGFSPLGLFLWESVGEVWTWELPLTP